MYVCMCVCMYCAGQEVDEKWEMCNFFVDEFSRAIESGVSPANFSVS